MLVFHGFSTANCGKLFILFPSDSLFFVPLHFLYIFRLPKIDFGTLNGVFKRFSTGIFRFSTWIHMNNFSFLMHIFSFYFSCRDKRFPTIFPSSPSFYLTKVKTATFFHNSLLKTYFSVFGTKSGYLFTIVTYKLCFFPFELSKACWNMLLITPAFAALGLFHREFSTACCG